LLAESALTSQLSALTLKESKGCNVEGICWRSNADGFAESSSGNLASQFSQAESLKHPLSAVCKSILAASRIFQTFKVESFHRKNVVEYGIMIADHLMRACFHLFLLRMPNLDRMIWHILLQFVSKTSLADGKEWKGLWLFDRKSSTYTGILYASFLIIIFFVTVNTWLFQVLILQTYVSLLNN
jgi:hypothetical protein